MTGRRTITVLIFLLLTVVVVLGGCGDNGATTEYVKATCVKSGISFSFEYPSSYTKLTPDAFEDNVSDNSVSLLYYAPDSNQAKADIQLYIIPLTPIPDRSDAFTWSDGQIKLLEKGDPGFILYERSEIQISGIDGYEIVYFTTVLGNYLHSPKLNCWDAYIDYKEYTWKISALSVEESAGQAESDFQHMIESFQFLD